MDRSYFCASNLAMARSGFPVSVRGSLNTGTKRLGRQ